MAGLGHIRRDARTGRWYIDLRPTARVYTFATQVRLVNLRLRRAA